MLDSTNFRDIVNYYNQYDVITQFKMETKKVYISDAKDGVCRFCGCVKPEVSFRNDAHAIPEFLGNTKVFSKNECDVCNAFFSASCEDHLAKYLGITRTLMQMKGKNGIPTYKANNQVGRIEVTKSGIKITDLESDSMISLDVDTNSLLVKGDCQPFRPISVYKAFVKMALSIIPYEYLHDFSDVVKWIRYEKEDEQTLLINPCTLIQKFIPGPRPLDGLATIVFKRKNNESMIPYMLLVLATGNYQFQIVVPCPQQDHFLHGKEISIVSFPTPFDMIDSEYGSIQTQIIDLSETNIRRDEPSTVTMHIDSPNQTNPC